MRGRRGLPEGARVSTFTGLSLRSLRARPLRSLLTSLAIVLGVGMVFGVLLLVGTIHSTFDRLFDSVYGRTDLVVSGQQSIGSLPASTIEKVRAVPGVQTASGQVFSVFRMTEEDGSVDRSRASQLVTVGLDFSQPRTADMQVTAGREPAAGLGEIEISRDWAAKRGLRPGDAVRLSTPNGLSSFRVAGIFEYGGVSDLGGYGAAALPLEDARALMGKDGWDEIDVVLADGAAPATVQRRLKAALGRGVEVSTPASKSQESMDQLAALDILLYFFSGIALFVGAFLILNSFNMTVLQRTREIGTLRALGATDRRVARSLLAEAAILGIVGSLGGLALGAGLAVLLVNAMESFGMPVSHIEYSVTPGIVAVVVGLLATLAGAAWPAIRAGRTPPIRALLGDAGTARAPGRRRALVGLAFFVPGMVLGGVFWFGTTSTSAGVRIGAVVSTMVLFLGMVRLAPFVVMPIVALLSRPMQRLMPAEGRLAADAARANPGRTAATAATLLVALSVVVVNATVASSFVGSVKEELDKRYARDLTVQPIGFTEYGPPQAGIAAGLQERLAALDGVAAVARRRSVYVTHMPAGGADGLLVGYDPYEYDRVDKVAYEDAPRAAVLSGMAAGGVVPSVAFAKTQGLHVGDRVRLTGPAGTRSAPVVGIADTFDGGGQVLQMSLRTMAGVYGITSDSQLIVKASSPAVRKDVARHVEALLDRDHPGLESLSTAEYKQRTTDVINQQFGFFNAIVGIAVLVGVLGIINTLTMSVLERTREIGVLRALGASRWRVRRTMGDESLLISVAGTVAGLLMGLLVAIVWVIGMRKTTFPGMSMHLPWTLLATITVLGVVIGVLAAVLPARRAARLDPLQALRYE